MLLLPSLFFLLLWGERQKDPSDGEFFDVDAVVVGDSDFDIAEVHPRGKLPDHAEVSFPIPRRNSLSSFVVISGSSVGGVSDGVCGVSSF